MLAVVRAYCDLRPASKVARREGMSASGIGVSTVWIYVGGVLFRGGFHLARELCWCPFLMMQNLMPMRKACARLLACLMTRDGRVNRDEGCVPASRTCVTNVWIYVGGGTVLGGSLWARGLGWCVPG